MSDGWGKKLWTRKRKEEWKYSVKWHGRLQRDGEEGKVWEWQSEWKLTDWKTNTKKSNNVVEKQQMETVERNNT